MRVVAMSLVVAAVAACSTTHTSDRVSQQIDIPRVRLQTGIPLRGRVLYPGGAPAGGATVYADPICGHEFGFSNSVRTAEDGTFMIPSVDPSCGEIRFTAEKPEDFWLRTGDDHFYPHRNVTAPEVVLSADQAPDPVTIQLELRGGILELRAWDMSVARDVEAILEVECSGLSCGALVAGTGADAAGYTVLLPPRRYRVSLEDFSCGGAETFWADNKPSITVDVVEGQRQSAVLKFDPKMVRAVATWYQPREFPCRD